MITEEMDELLRQWDAILDAETRQPDQEAYHTRIRISERQQAGATVAVALLGRPDVLPRGIPLSLYEFTHEFLVIVRNSERSFSMRAICIHDTISERESELLRKATNREAMKACAQAGIVGMVAIGWATVAPNRAMFN